MKGTNKQRPPDGEIRQSQIITTFGPGVMVDLPDDSIMVGGLAFWKGERRLISEERLAVKVADALKTAHIKLCAPPPRVDDPSNWWAGIHCFIFPRYFLAQVDDTWEHPVSKRRYRTRPLVSEASLEKGKFLGPNRKKCAVVPVRFVQACVNGHISDIKWRAFAHNDPATPCHGQLWMDEGGTSGDLGDVFVRCDCGARRVLSNATLKGVLGRCHGERPWLGNFGQEPCQSSSHDGAEWNRLLIRSASNAYFPQVLSVISIPDTGTALRHALDAQWDNIGYAENHVELAYELKKPKIKAAFATWTAAQVWAEIMHRRSGTAPEVKSLKQLEIETLLSSEEEIGEDVQDGHFYARALPSHELGEKLTPWIERVVLVHRLREVQALLGFTRFDAVVPDTDGELSLNVQRAALAQDPTWVPAVENLGEGFLIGLRADAISAWCARPAVQRREEALRRGFEVWAQRHGSTDFKFPGMPYIMLHSLAHLLIHAVSLESGYAASAIKERIYAGDSGHGILLYTGSPGTEGTLGGLVQIGRRLERHLLRALELGRLCSNDPICAQHQPDNAYEERFLHGAACHGCLLVSETCCERRNEFLDRALVVGTISGDDAGFFGELTP
jgi:hypothetical protein